MIDFELPSAIASRRRSRLTLLIVATIGLAAIALELVVARHLIG